MAAPKLTEADFVRLFEEKGPHQLAKHMDCTPAHVFARRRRLEIKLNRAIKAPDKHPNHHNIYEEHPGRLDLAVNNGIVLVGSDLHAWPGEPSTAFRAFLKFIKQLQPKAVVMNGDVIDGASISRHAPQPGWEKQPTLIEEIESAQERLHDVELAASKRAELIWPLGNHDARFSVRLATVAPEYADIHGTKIKDHFGDRWKPCWSVWINDQVVIKHRYKAGIHVPHNATMWAGKSIVTGHLHSLKVAPLTDYSGTRFGVDCGCLAEPYAPQFRYLEDNPRNWRSGFCVLTFKDSTLLWPELVAVRKPGEVEWRGEIVKV